MSPTTWCGPSQDRPVRSRSPNAGAGDTPGVHSSFLRHCETAAARYGLVRWIFSLSGQLAGWVGGQEGMINVALDSAQQQIMMTA
ncbi:hypothetical protein ACLK1S_02210 [Escherichia coli]